MPSNWNNMTDSRPTPRQLLVLPSIGDELSVGATVMAPIACRAVKYKEGGPFRVAPFKPWEFSVPFCLGETRRYFKQCDLFCSFHAIVELQFGAWLDSTQQWTTIKTILTPSTTTRIWHSRQTGHSGTLLWAPIRITSTPGLWMGPAWVTSQSSCIACLGLLCTLVGTGTGSAILWRNVEGKDFPHQCRCQQ